LFQKKSRQGGRDLVNSLRRTLDEPRWGVVIPFKIDRPAARVRSGKSLEVRRLERMDRAHLILNMMQRESLGFRDVGTKFGISGPMAFKLVKELRQSSEQEKYCAEASSS
jgi:hypothetical protein